MTLYRMVDMDNRDDDNIPYEFTGDAEKVIRYLDGPVRRDSLPPSIAKLDAAIQALRAGDDSEAYGLAIGLGVYLFVVERSFEDELLAAMIEPLTPEQIAKASTNWTCGLRLPS